MKKKNDPVVTESVLERALTKFKDEMLEVFSNYRNDIMNKMDEVMGELENHRIEQGGIKADIKDLKKHFTN